MPRFMSSDDDDDDVSSSSWLVYTSLTSCVAEIQCLRSRSSVQDRDRSEDRTPRDRKSKDRVSHVIFEVTTEYLFKIDRYANEKNELLLYNSCASFRQFQL
jgi:UDP-N-acetylmuramoylalanine-D-glutamate ligase